ncbi:MAG: hypothetical protein IT422_07490 [Pirellulaceae bacterium]|jgi:hypothetical protein|nr:hypothetical protein [Pirellulaceae bacterium]
MKSSYLIAVLLSAVVIANAGCGPADFNFTKKPSYADLVVTYNAEVETLDNLEEKRKSLIADYVGQLQRNAMEAAVESIKTGDAKRVPENPNQALDKAVAAAEMQAQLQSGLLDGLGLSNESAESTADYPEELKSKLAELDAEIASQKERVQRAKDARDAAQPK